MGKLDQLWKKTEFNANDPGEKYCEFIITEGTTAPLIDLPDDAPLPDFYDRSLFAKAQKYHSDFYVFISTSNVIGVMVLFGVENILDILVCTKQSSTPVTAFKRYAETLMLIENLFKDSPEDPSSLCSKSLLAIRKKHKHGSAMGVRRVQKFINQRDMAITQNSFMGYVVAYYRAFGLPYDPERMYALCHFWRVVGYMLGIEDRFNLCNGDLTTVTSRSEAIFRHILVPGMLNAPQDFDQMTEAYFNGLSGISTEFDCEKFIFITKRLSQVPGYYLNESERQGQIAYMDQYPHYIPKKEAIVDSINRHPEKCKAFQQLKWSHRWDLLFTEYLLENVVPKSAAARYVFNFIHLCRIFMLKHFPVLAMYKFGYRNAFVRVLQD